MSSSAKPAIGSRLATGGSGPAVELRPLAASDRDPYLRALRASRATVESRVPLNEAGESDDAYFERQLELCQIGDATGRGWRRVAAAADGSIAGCFNLNTISRGLNWDADAVFWVAAAWRRRGVARLGLQAMLDVAFADLPNGLGLAGVHAGVEPSNIACVKLVTSCEFVRVDGSRSHLKVGEDWLRHDLYIARPSDVEA